MNVLENDYDQLIKKDRLVFLSYSIKTKLINFVFTRFPQRYTAGMILVFFVLVLLWYFISHIE